MLNAIGYIGIFLIMLFVIIALMVVGIIVFVRALGRSDRERRRELLRH